MMEASQILIVEDEALIGLDIRKSLKRLGYRVLPPVASGTRALEKVEQYAPDLVLMDINLEGELDGIETACYIRERFNIPIIYLTAHTDPKTIYRAKDTTPFGYIIKPYEDRDLLAAIEMAMARATAERKTQEALKKAEELNELKSRFVSMVSHEFRTPLASISLSAGMLQNYKHKLSEDKQQVHFQRIQSSIAQMNNLLEDVLTIGQAESGKWKFNPAPLDLYEFCQQLVEEQAENDEGKHSINFHASGKTDKTVMDERLLRHIFSNLLSNAIKYSPVQTAVDFKLEFDREWVTIQVRDRGIGIPPEDCDRLFETFQRATNVGSIKGTGIGLAIVKQAVDLHGGTIDFDSQVGIGTTFIVRLPCQPCCDLSFTSPP
jgi:signal transduction histidine kinase